MTGKWQRFLLSYFARRFRAPGTTASGSASRIRDMSRTVKGGESTMAISLTADDVSVIRPDVARAADGDDFDDWGGWDTYPDVPGSVADW
jgi:hypothetical protein